MWFLFSNGMTNNDNESNFDQNVEFNILGTTGGPVDPEKPN